MRPPSLKALSVLASILALVSTTTSSAISMPTPGTTTQTNHKRKTTNSPPSGPAEYPPTECPGPLPPPQAFGNNNPPGAFATLHDWCVHGPADCKCVYRDASHDYTLRCALDDHLLDTVPGIVNCHNSCSCEEAEEHDRARLQALARAALVVARVRHGLPGPGRAATS
ncbi:hypothetical protein MMC16_001573 [Acarospora aff. strigata]|nr:hypothetical protein [Acarospora aff. strigata]